MFLCINTCPMNEAITRLYGIMDKSDSSVPVFNGKNIFSSIMNGSSEFNTYGNFDAIFSQRGSRFKFADFGIKNFTEWADDCVWQGESGIRILDMRSPNWLTIIDNNGNVYAYTPKVYGNAKNISRDKVVLARFDVSSHSTFCNVKPLTFTVNRAFSWEAARNFVVFQDLDDYKIGDNVMVDGRILAVVSKELLPKNNSTEKTPTYTAVNINTDASKNYKYSPYNKGDIITIYPESELLSLPAGTYKNHMGKSVTYLAQTTITRYPFKLRSRKDNNTDDPIATLGSSWVVDEPYSVCEECKSTINGISVDSTFYSGSRMEHYAKQLPLSRTGIGSSAGTFTYPIPFTSLLNIEVWKGYNSAGFGDYTRTIVLPEGLAQSLTYVIVYSGSTVPGTDTYMTQVSARASGTWY